MKKKKYGKINCSLHYIYPVLISNVLTDSLIFKYFFMLVNRNDYDHLVKQLNSDIPLLVKKIDDIRNLINKKLEKRKLYGPKLKKTEWRNHKTDILWVIYYNVSKENDKTAIQFTPITSFNDRDGTKSYFVLCMEILNSNSAEKHLFKVFSGHFIAQYLKRTQSKINDPYHVIIDFITIQDLTLNYEYKQNEKWKMFFEAKGVAMVREDRLCLVFDTFIILSDLFPDQENAIREYIDDMLINNPVDFLISLFVLLYPGSAWGKYITEDILSNAYKKTFQENPELANAVIKQLALKMKMQE